MKRIFRLIVIFFVGMVCLFAVIFAIPSKTPPPNLLTLATPTENVSAQITSLPTEAPTIIPVTQSPTDTPSPSAIPAPSKTPAPLPTPIGYISRETVGEKWPIKDVDAGIVRCTRLTGGVQVITFAANGKTYAVNGSAKTRMNDFGWENVETIQNRELNDIGLLKYPITPILDLGLSLCR